MAGRECAQESHPPSGEARRERRSRRRRRSPSYSSYSYSCLDEEGAFRDAQQSQREVLRQRLEKAKADAAAAERALARQLSPERRRGEYKREGPPQMRPPSTPPPAPLSLPVASTAAHGETDRSRSRHRRGRRSSDHSIGVRSTASSRPAQRAESQPVSERGRPRRRGRSPGSRQSSAPAESRPASVPATSRVMQPTAKASGHMVAQPPQKKQMTEGSSKRSVSTKSRQKTDEDLDSITKDDVSNWFELVDVATRLAKKNGCAKLLQCPCCSKSFAEVHALWQHLSGMVHSDELRHYDEEEFKKLDATWAEYEQHLNASHPVNQQQDDDVHRLQQSSSSSSTASGSKRKPPEPAEPPAASRAKLEPSLPPTTVAGSHPMSLEPHQQRRSLSERGDRKRRRRRIDSRSRGRSRARESHHRRRHQRTRSPGDGVRLRSAHRSEDRMASGDVHSPASDEKAKKLVPHDLSPELCRIVAGVWTQSPVLWKLTEMGCRTASDIANFFADFDEMAQVCEGEGMTKPQIAEFVPVYCRIVKEADAEMARMALHMTSAARPIKKTLSPQTVAKPLGPPAPRSTLVVETGEGTNRVDPSGPTAPAASKKDKMTNLLWQQLCQAAHVVKDWEDFPAGDARENFRKLLMRPVDRLSESRIIGVTSSMRRWLTWAAKKRVDDPYRPNAGQLGRFLQEVSAGGPTAASSVFKALTWWQATYGIPFPVTSPLVVDFRHFEPSHTVRQAVVLEPWQLFNLCVLLQDSSGATRLATDLVCLVTTGCIRFEHLQRSILKEELVGPKFGQNAVAFHCHKGKVRQQGARPAYDWCVPAWKPALATVTAESLRFYKDNADWLKQEAFLVPGLKRDPSAPGVLHSDSTWSRVAMKRAAFVEMLRGLLIKAGTEPERVHEITFNSLRRFMPTLAMVLNMDPEARQAIGSWQEIPQGGSNADVKQTRKMNLMSIRYASDDSKLRKSFLAKLAALQRLTQIIKKVTENRSSYMLPGSLTWQKLAEVNEIVASEDVQQLAFELEPELIEATGVGPQELEQFHSDVSSDSSEDSSSSDSSDEDKVSIPAEVEIAWFQQQANGVAHIAQEQLGTELVPYCRESPFKAEHAEKGEGLHTVPKKICVKCLARLPGELRRQVKALTTVDKAA